MGDDQLHVDVANRMGSLLLYTYTASPSLFASHETLQNDSRREALRLTSSIVTGIEARLTNSKICFVSITLYKMTTLLRSPLRPIRTNAVVLLWWLR